MGNTEMLELHGGLADKQKKKIKLEEMLETKEGTYKNLQKKYDDKQSLRKKAEDRNKTMELIKLHKFEKLNLESQKANAEHRKLNKDISTHQTSLTKSKADADKKSRDTKKYDEPIKQLRDENDALDIR